MLTWETTWGLLRAVLVGLLLAVLLLRLFEDRLIFFPDLFSEDVDPARAGVPVGDVFFTTSDGVRLHGWFSSAEGATHTILYFHGNAGNLAGRIDNIGFLRRLPANVFAVDYRGYGKSQGRPSEPGVYRDAEAAYDYLVKERGVRPDRIVVLGQSLGSAVAVDLAAKRPVAVVILEAGFPSARRVAEEAIWIPGLGYLLRSKFDSARKLKSIRVPVLVAHCRQDPVIPFKLGEELFAAANEPKQFIAYTSGCHEPLYAADPDGYAVKLRKFFWDAQEAQEAKD